MMSMSGGWFFVVASEAIMVGDTTVKLPGIGSWLALAIEQQDIAAVVLAVATMGVVILAYDQLLFRPIVAWADKFRFEQTAAQQRPQSWVYDLVRRARLIKRISACAAWATGHLAGCRRSDSGFGQPPAVAAPPGSAGPATCSGSRSCSSAPAMRSGSAADYVRATLGPRRCPRGASGSASSRSSGSWCSSPSRA